MSGTLVRHESPIEFFRELVESALQHQHVAVRQLTSFYVVNLLAGSIHSDRSPIADDEALGIRFVRALQAGGMAQRDGLRQVGDASLFISGFFSDSLHRSLVDIDYYMQLGERAYGSLARSNERLADVFDELSAKFPAIVDVLTEVSERTSLSSDGDLLRLYEKWLRTGSQHRGAKLAARGLVPNASVASRRVQ